MSAARSGSDIETPESAVAETLTAVDAAQPATSAPSLEEAPPVEVAEAAPVVAPAATEQSSQAEPAETTDAVIEPVTAVPAAIPLIVPEQVEAVTAKPPVVEEVIATAPVRPAPRPAARKPTPPPKLVEISETPPVKPAAPPQPSAPAKKAEVDTNRQTAPASRIGAGRVQETPVLQGGDLANLPGGGPVGKATDSYMNQLRYWLDRHKTYPRDARRKRMQGVVVLYFRVTRDGVILNHRIRTGSGYDVLDAEVEAMLARAQPLPVFPETMKGGYLDVVVPIEFSLRGNS